MCKTTEHSACHAFPQMCSTAACKQLHLVLSILHRPQVNKRSVTLPRIPWPDSDFINVTATSSSTASTTDTLSPGINAGTKHYTFAGYYSYNEWSTNLHPVSEVKSIHCCLHLPTPEVLTIFKHSGDEVKMNGQIIARSIYTWLWSTFQARPSRDRANMGR